VKKLQKEYDELSTTIATGIKKITEYNTKAAGLQKEMDYENSYEGKNALYSKKMKEIDSLDAQIASYRYAHEQGYLTDLTKYNGLRKKRNELLREANILDDEMVAMRTEATNKENNKTEPQDTPLLPDPDDKEAKKILQEKIKNIDKEAALKRIARMKVYKDQKSFEEELLQIERETIQEKQKLYKEGSEEYVKYQEELAKFDLRTTQDNEKAELDRQEKIKALIAKYNKEAATTDEQQKELELNALNELFSEELRTTEQYLQLKKAIEDKYDPEKKKNLEIAKQLIADNPKPSKNKKDLSKLSDADLTAAKDADLAQLDALEALHNAEIDAIIDYEEMRLLIEQKYKDIRETKDEEEFKKKLQLTQFALEQMSTLLSAYSSYVQASQDAETAAIEAKYNKQIKAAGKNSARVEKLEKQKEEELAKVRAEYEEKSFAIQVAQALASTAMAAINAYSSAAIIPVVGTVLAPIAAGVATAAGLVQVAAIKKQHEAAKANYYTGGFTPSGPWDEPQGVVHSNEFVANHLATGNPILRPVFDVLDYAQRNNTIASLDKKDIARALGMKGFAEGGYVNQTVVHNNTQSIDTSSLAALERVLDRLDKKLDEPFVGEVFVTGRRGIKENMNQYDRMIKNASRA
jgi:hypothetical protein